MILSNKLNQINLSYRQLVKKSRNLSKNLNKTAKNEIKPNDERLDKKIDRDSDSFNNYFDDFAKFCEDYKNYAYKIFLKIQYSKMKNPENDESKSANSALFCLRYYFSH